MNTALIVRLSIIDGSLFSITYEIKVLSSYEEGMKMGLGVPLDVHLNFVYFTIYQMIALLERPAVVLLVLRRKVDTF